MFKLRIKWTFLSVCQYFDTSLLLTEVSVFHFFSFEEYSRHIQSFYTCLYVINNNACSYLKVEGLKEMRVILCSPYCSWEFCRHLFWSCSVFSFNVYVFSYLSGSQQQGHEERFVHSCPCNSNRYSMMKSLKYI